MREKININIANIIFVIFIILFFIYTYNFNKNHSYSIGETSESAPGLAFAKGKVISVNNDEVEENGDSYFEGAHKGEQFVELEILEGEYKGKLVQCNNYLLTTNYMFLKENDRVLIQITKDVVNDEMCYSIYQYDRRTVIYMMIVLFALIIILVGKMKGVKTVLALCFALYTILYFTLPLIYHGKSPIMISILTVVLISAITLFLLNGWSEKTKAAFISTTLGVISAGVIYSVFSALLHITGFHVGEASSILLIKATYGLQVRDILFATILIASLGAVMDVGMSISSALHEIVEMKPDITKKQLFVSGMNIGKDMIGTMTNTLILAFVGSSFISIMTIALSEMKVTQLINSNYFAVELLQGLSATMAVVLTVPIASFTSAYLYTEQSKLIKRN